MAQVVSLAERFWSKVDKRDPAECWVWTAALDRKGYGKFFYGKRVQGAHRVAWLLANDKEADKFVCHACDNPRCVNPNHLWLGTRLDNARDMVAKGRQRYGPDQPSGRKETCTRGHLRTPENLSPNGSGRTTCRLCRLVRRGKATA